MGCVEEGFVEGKKDSWLCEPGESNLYLGVEGRDDGRGGVVSLGVVRRPNVEVGGIEIGEEGRRSGSWRGTSSDDMEDSSFHVRDSGGSVAVKVNLVSSRSVDNEGFSTGLTTSLRFFASSWASLRVAFESE